VNANQAKLGIRHHATGKKLAALLMFYNDVLLLGVHNSPSPVPHAEAFLLDRTMRRAHGRTCFMEAQWRYAKTWWGGV